MNRVSMLVSVLVAAPLLIGVPGDQSASNKSSDTLEGVLRIHPKFHYRYYIDGFGDGQECALFQADERLKRIKPGSVIRVRGDLASNLFGGNPKDKRSALIRTWVIYMDVEQVEVLRGPVRPSRNPPPGVSNSVRRKPDANYGRFAESQKQQPHEATRRVKPKSDQMTIRSVETRAGAVLETHVGDMVFHSVELTFLHDDKSTCRLRPRDGTVEIRHGDSVVSTERLSAALNRSPLGKWSTFSDLGDQILKGLFEQ
ncbi:MAG: hypothetical protein CMJ48_08270 [Planctomycetaceae bacterium]|nr:hypothetical protein [Planctomycetaceae bacterium]